MGFSLFCGHSFCLYWESFCFVCLFLCFFFLKSRKRKKRERIYSTLWLISFRGKNVFAKYKLEAKRHSVPWKTTDWLLLKVGAKSNRFSIPVSRELFSTILVLQSAVNNRLYRRLFLQFTPAHLLKKIKYLPEELNSTWWQFEVTRSIAEK